jgi:hypothetical protein
MLPLKGEVGMRVLALIVGLLFQSTSFAQEVIITAADTVQSVLNAQKGKRVTVRTRNGQELTGTVREANAKIIVLGTLSGRDFFDAVVPIEAVDAILIRIK